MRTNSILMMNGPWQFLGLAPQSLEPSAVRLPEAGDAGWLDIAVPGDVNQALLEHGKIPDPHYDVNARQCYWVTAREWWYRCSFDAPSFRDALDLTFETADGPADAWLNGRYLGLMDNAHRPWTFDVARHAKPAGNILLVRFRSIDQLLGGPRLDELAGWKNRRAFLRKPQYNFGWDWALPLPSIGLGGPVTLAADARARFKDFGLRTFADGRVDFFFEVSREARDAGYEIFVRVDGHGAHVKERVPGAASPACAGHGTDPAAAAAARFKSYTSLRIPRPRLWWPNGMGAAALYEYRVILRCGGRVVDERAGRLGLREVDIVEEPFRRESGPGFSFGFKVNGVPVFIKGTNLAPLELWPANAGAERYRFTLGKCRDAHFNMVRVWGGGIYEKDILYDQCDELGLLVWQDFMFAGAPYPLPLLRDSIVAEAQHQIRRLRNHPCLGLWCGCNEDVFSWSYPEERAASAQADTGPHAAEDDKWRVDRLKHDPELYTMLLRGLVSRFGMGVPYIESSPQSHDDAGNRPNSGNSHVSSFKYALIESGGHPETFRRHFEATCSFDSEFCIQGPCSAPHLKRFLAPAHHWPPDEAWIYHIQRGHLNLPHYEQHLRVAGGIFGEMTDLETYVKHGQATHAEMMRGEFESARRNRPDCGGTMFWMFNDCWPTSNWSVIDYYGEPKPAYYAAKRACAPLLPIVMERRGVIEFFMSNESSRDARVEYAYGVESLDGRRRRERVKRFTLPANGVRRIDGMAKPENELPPGDFWFVRARSGGRRLPAVAYFPDRWKGIAWPAPDVQVRASASGRAGAGYRTRVRVSTDVFARMCHLAYPDARAGAWFGDNDFDLPAGEAHSLVVESARPLQPRRIAVRHWRSDAREPS